MPGCFSSIFTSKKQSSSLTKITKEPIDVETKSTMTSATPCYCSSQGAATGYADKPPAYTPSLEKNIFRPEVLKFIEERTEFYSPELRELSLKIHSKSQENGNRIATSLTFLRIKGDSIWRKVGSPIVAFPKNWLISSPGRPTTPYATLWQLTDLTSHHTTLNWRLLCVPSSFTGRVVEW